MIKNRNFLSLTLATTLLLTNGLVGMENKSASYLENLPEPVRRQILAELQPYELCCVAFTSKKLYHVIMADEPLKCKVVANYLCRLICYIDPLHSVVKGARNNNRTLSFYPWGMNIDVKSVLHYLIEDENHNLDPNKLCYPSESPLDIARKEKNDDLCEFLEENFDAKETYLINCKDLLEALIHLEEHSEEIRNKIICICLYHIPIHADNYANHDDSSEAIKKLASYPIVKIKYWNPNDLPINNIKSLNSLSINPFIKDNELSDEIFKLASLKELSLFGLKAIRELPDKFDLLPSLRVLDLRCIPLTHLPPTIIKLTNLRVLKLPGYNCLPGSRMYLSPFCLDDESEKIAKKLLREQKTKVYYS